MNVNCPTTLNNYTRIFRYGHATKYHFLLYKLPQHRFSNDLHAVPYWCYNELSVINVLPILLSPSFHNALPWATYHEEDFKKRRWYLCSCVYYSSKFPILELNEALSELPAKSIPEYYYDSLEKLVVPRNCLEKQSEFVLYPCTDGE